MVALMQTTLLEAISSLYPENSKSSLRKWIEQGRVTVDGQAVKKNISLSSEQKIDLLRKKPVRKNLNILYEDDHIVVVDKPVGLLSVATMKKETHTLHNYLKQQFGKVWPVHRLDRETSGVLVFALSEAVKEGMKQQFIDHTIRREYFGIVEGRLEGSGTWRSNLIDDANYVVRVREDGELAITNYQVISNFEDMTLVRFRLKTGKKNQIRVQASHADHPIVGDRKYGATNFTLGRLALHAHTLEFAHPITKKNLSFISPLPAIFNRYEKALSRPF